jgi:DnaK suppressor protein
MSQLHSFDQTPATASGDSGPDTDGVGAVVDYFSGKKPPPLPRVHAFEFRVLLQAQRRRLLDEMHEIMTPAGAKNTIDGSPLPIAVGAPQTPDAIVAADAAIMTVIRNSQQLQEVEVALERISDGSYGVCIFCGEGIDRARLKFQPTTRYCLPCQIQLIPPVRPAGET